MLHDIETVSFLDTKTWGILPKGKICIARRIYLRSENQRYILFTKLTLISFSIILIMLA